MTDGSFWTAYLTKLAITAVVLAALYLAGRRLRAMRPFSGRGRCLTVVETTALCIGLDSQVYFVETAGNKIAQFRYFNV